MARSAHSRRRVAEAPAAGFPLLRFVRNLALAAVPVVLVWLAITPLYDRFLIAAGENLVHLTESPDVTGLLPAVEDPHYALILRHDFPPARERVSSLRVTDLHFHLVLLAAFFLAVPDVPWRRAPRQPRLGAAGGGVLPPGPGAVLGQVRLRHPARGVEPRALRPGRRATSGASASTCSTFPSSSPSRSSCGPRSTCRACCRPGTARHPPPVEEGVGRGAPAALRPHI